MPQSGTNGVSAANPERLEAVAGDLRESVVLCGASSCQSQRAPSPKLLNFQISQSRKTAKRFRGAFASFPGSHGVDVTSALFPVWGFVGIMPPDSPQVIASVRVPERDYQRHGLVRRDDRTPHSHLEGAFLPATFWLAQYWAVRNDIARACEYIDAAPRHANDVGVLPTRLTGTGVRRSESAAGHEAREPRQRYRRSVRM